MTPALAPDASPPPRPLTAGARLAVGTLTVIPVGAIGEITPVVARRAMLLAPLAAVPLAVLTATTLAVAYWLELPSLAGGLIAVGALALGTRAMHVDGLADTVDGLGAGWSRERALEVMKRGDVGPMGMTAVLVALGLQTVALAALAPSPLVAGAAVVVSRGVCTALCARGLRPARPEGLGAPMIGSVPRAGATAVIGVCAALLIAAATFDGGRAGLAGALAALAMATLATLCFARRVTRVIGGITGDVLGAGVEIVLTTVLVVLSAHGWGLS